MSVYLLLHIGILRLGGQKKLLRGLSFYFPPFPLRQDLSLYLGFIFFQLDWSPASLRYPSASTFLKLWLRLCVDACLTQNWSLLRTGVTSVCGPLASCSLDVGIWTLYSAATTLNCYAISPAPLVDFNLCFFFFSFCESQFPILRQNDSSLKFAS